jgi:hypothetical protein
MISVMCACGKRLKTEDRHAGKRTKCPNCGADAVFPSPEPAAVGAVEQEVAFVELDGFPTEAPAGPQAKPASLDETPTRSPRTERVGPRVVPVPPETRGREFQAVVFTLLAIAFFMAGFGSVGPSRSFNPESISAHRFRNDNATGAAANALEHIAGTPPAHDAAPWFIAGLLCVLIVKVDGLRWTLARRT